MNLTKILLASVILIDFLIFIYNFYKFKKLRSWNKEMNLIKISLK